jgi:hypothetical protein
MDQGSSKAMNSAPTANANKTPHAPSTLAAFLSYLVPGLGQIYQKRYGKGALFMVSLLGMFMLGQAMGQWQNVYVPREQQRGNLVNSLVLRWHYVGQFWIGVAAWPALYKYFNPPPPPGFTLTLEAHDPAKKDDVIRAVEKLTKLAMKEAKEVVEGPPRDILHGLTKDKALQVVKELEEAGAKASIEKTPLPFFARYQRVPDETELNVFLVNSDKTPDLGWVYTVVAGMLNILVMYDAYAGPIFLAVPKPAAKESSAPKTQAHKEGVA